MKTNNELQTLAAAANPFFAYADAAAPRNIVGKLLKFSKGDYLVDDEVVAIGTTFTANLDEMLVGWVRWWDNTPTEHQMGRLIDAFRPPRRVELGDTDETAWGKNTDGTPRDPWQFTNYVPLKDGEGDLYTYATSSRGGISAVARLCRLYGRRPAEHADAFPVISLNVDSYDHSNRAYGKIKFPVLQIVGWEAKAGFGGPFTPATGNPPPQLPLQAAATVTDTPKVPITAEFNDEIPY